MNINKLKNQIINEITGEKGMHITGSWESDLEKLIVEVDTLSIFNPISRRSYCHNNIEAGDVELDLIHVNSHSLSRFLEHSDECVIMSATLGPRVDSKMAILQMTDMAKAYLYDLVCLHYFEMKLDEWEVDLRDAVETENKHLTNRFSPGYGDLSLDIQGDVLTYLDAQKRVGIELTENNLMIPQKSVTAILGIGNKPFDNSYSRCDACLRRDRCTVKGGGRCEFI